VSERERRTRVKEKPEIGEEVRGGNKRETRKS